MVCLVSHCVECAVVCGAPQPPQSVSVRLPFGHKLGHMWAQPAHVAARVDGSAVVVVFRTKGYHLAGSRLVCGYFVELKGYLAGSRLVWGYFAESSSSSLRRRLGAAARVPLHLRHKCVHVLIHTAAPLHGV
jgi:hypothetical protein